MRTEQAETRLEVAIQSTDHLLARYAETPCAGSDDEWLKLIAAQSRELVRAASDYLDSDHAPQPAMRPEPVEREETPMQTTDAQTQDTADLESLGAELTARGYRAEVRTLADRLPYLDVCNPRAAVLAEKVFVEGESYWFSWAERIAARDDADTAAGILARVLRAISE